MLIEFFFIIFYITGPVDTHGHTGFGRGNLTTVPSRVKRRCIFCKQYFLRLSLHLMDVHKDHERIKALKIISSKERNAELARIRAEGIFQHNEMTKADGTENYQCRRRGKFCDSQLQPYCTNCKPFFASRHFNRHKCISQERKTRSLLTNLKGPQAREFEKSILVNLRSDVLGEFIKKSDLIVALGFEEFRVYEASGKKKSAIIRTNQFLRQFGRIVFETHKLMKVDHPAVELEGMFKRRHLTYFERAFENIARTEEGTTLVSKKNFGYTFKRGLVTLKVLLEMNERSAEDVMEAKNFLDLFNNRWRYNFRESEIKSRSRRIEHGRRPQNLPAVEDVSKLNSYIAKELQDLLQLQLSPSDFIRVRRTVASKLLLLNTRRPEEVASLTLKDVKDGLNEIWIRRKTEATDASKFFITYGKAKNSSSDVSVLLPKKLKKLYEFLMNEDVRKNARVLNSNLFIFPSINSDRQTSTYHDFKTVTSNVGLSLTATQLRHYSSSEYEARHGGTSDNSAFYEHMGHSETMNKRVYQVPRAEQTLLTVAPILDEINGSTGI